MANQDTAAAAAIGKSVNQETDTFGKPVGAGNQDSPDTRSLEDTAKGEPLKIQPAELEGNENLANMSFQDIEKAFGLEIGDKSLEQGPAGDATLFETQRRMESGEAVAATEDVLVAAAQQDAGKPAEQSAAPAVPDPAKAAAPAAAAAPAGQDPAAAPAGEQFVETRDGKGKIPYSVLEAARAQTAAAIEQARRATQELEAFKAGKTLEAERAAAAKGTLTDEQIADMREQFPGPVVDALEALNKANADLKGQVFDLTKGAAKPSAAASTTLTPEEQARQTSQDLIDQDPMLSQWQNAEDQTNWQRAVAFDDTLAKDPVWKTKPLQERFAEVRRLMGHPIEAAPTQTETEAEKAIRIAREAEAKATDRARAAGFTHSDLPGGTAPAQSERQGIEGMDIHTLAAKVDQMTPAQLESFLARV